jgi:hypothetical protein
MDRGNAVKKMNELSQEDIKAFEPEAKIGLIASINPRGEPHITLISSIRAKTTRQLMWGQFMEGMSKTNIKTNPDTGFLILTMDRQLWRGKARWTKEAKQGEDYEFYNNTPMFRYNAYFRINTIHYMDLVETYGRENLPMKNIIVSSILTKIAKGSSKTGQKSRILKPWAQGLLNNFSTLKFLSYIDRDGFPRIIPLLQCQAADSRRICFSPLAYRKELGALRNDTRVAVFVQTMDMENILLRGSFKGFSRFRSIQLGIIDLEWVYNSMPPKQGQIYPPEEIRPVVDF